MVAKFYPIRNFDIINDRRIQHCISDLLLKGKKDRDSLSLPIHLKYAAVLAVPVQLSI